ncbi:MAG: hypothetical protein ACP6IU_10770 [Candidatus Asgardarchaeia archaeon]
MVSEVIKIIDATKDIIRYEKYLYKCISPMPFRKYRNREKYLKFAIQKGLHKKILLFNGTAVDQIEYAPTNSSAYPISGDGIIVMNCIWVLRKAKGHNFGKLLFNEMLKDAKEATGIATIALENHWSPWFKKKHMEMFGFRAIDMIQVRHKRKHTDKCFKVYLMWLPLSNNKVVPQWDKKKMLMGFDFCVAHPLYRPKFIEKEDNIMELC